MEMSIIYECLLVIYKIKIVLLIFQKSEYIILQVYSNKYCKM